MTVSDLNMVSFLKSKMRWHQARQRVLADNVANADTPGYKPNDLVTKNFEELVKQQPTGKFSTTRTHKAHFQGLALSGTGPFESKDGYGFEIRPAGNAVTLEQEMMKVTQNQFDFRTATTLYNKSMGLIKTAIGRGR